MGVASETGLQPNTIMAARAVSARFPQIAEIDRVRPYSKPWHPSGLAIDIMIPNPDSPEGIALGDQILAFAMSNAGRLGFALLVRDDIRVELLRRRPHRGRRRCGRHVGGDHTHRAR